MLVADGDGEAAVVGSDDVQVEAETAADDNDNDNDSDHGDHDGGPDVQPRVLARVLRLILLLSRVRSCEKKLFKYLLFLLQTSHPLSVLAICDQSSKFFDG